eukprot:m.336031 g.336031  ORF g.336031 m.336031 type:complete len:211 (+) comp17738_c0_seq1:22-654(+)
MAESVALDALPYADGEFDRLPGAREQAMEAVRMEMRRMKREEGKDASAYLERLPPIPTLTESSTIEAELKRIKAKRKMEPMDMSRYEVPLPTGNKKNDMSAWNQSVENAQSQAEHQRNRLVNMELLSLYGTQSWKKNVGQLERVEKEVQRQLTVAKNQVQEINWQRKSEQLAAGENLLSLETRWGSQVSKNFEIEMACQMLEQEIKNLQS